MRRAFAMVARGAALVEVSGEGPYAPMPDGLQIPDGEITTTTIADGDRSFRVDASSSVQVDVTVIGYGAITCIVLRRCAGASANTGDAATSAAGWTTIECATPRARLTGQGGDVITIRTLMQRRQRPGIPRPAQADDNDERAQRTVRL